MRKVNNMNYKCKMASAIIKDNLIKLDKRQLKEFYSIIVHYWVKNRSFLSEQNFLNLWCELNRLCGEVDESFPDPYDDHNLLRSFCQAHPFYFIDRLSLELVINLFCRYFDDKLDILAMITNKLRTEGLMSAYTYSNTALDLTEDIEELVDKTTYYVKYSN